MSTVFTGGPLKMTVNLNSAGNIAQTGDTASGTKVLSFLNVDANYWMTEAMSSTDPDVFSSPLDAVGIINNLLGSTDLPAQRNYNITVTEDNDAVSKVKQLMEAKRNGNNES